MDDVGKIIMIITIIIAVIAVIGAVIRYIYFYKKEHFECPHCGNKFKPNVLNMIFSVNAVEGKIITCPKCGEKEYMEPKKINKRKEKNIGTVKAVPMFWF